MKKSHVWFHKKQSPARCGRDGALDKKIHYKSRFLTGFTLVELLVVIAIIAILAGLLSPAIRKARDMARSIQCVSNMRQIGIAMTSYMHDNNGFYPPRVNSDGNYFYHASINHYLGKPQMDYLPVANPNAFTVYKLSPVWLCPACNADNHYYLANCYTGNYYIFMDKIPTPYSAVDRFPASIILFTEGEYSSNTGGRLTDASFNSPIGNHRHNGGCNYLFCDGHVAFYLPDKTIYELSDNIKLWNPAYN